MKKIIILLLVSTILFAACKSEKQKEAIVKTDEMLVKIDSIKAELTAPEILAYNEIYDTTKVYIEYFEKLPPNFERTDSIMNIIYLYGTVDKCFKKLNSFHIPPILDELEMSKSQITNLQNDITEGFFKDDEIDNYIHIEDSILSELELMAKSKIEYAKQYAEMYTQLHPLIVNLKHNFEEKYK